MGQVVSHWSFIICSIRIRHCRYNRLPLLFVAYVAPIARIASEFGTAHHLHAGDTQFCISRSKLHHNSTAVNLENFLCAMHALFSQNGLVINPDKSEAVLFSTAQQTASSSVMDIAVPSFHWLPTLKSLGLFSIATWIWRCTLKASANQSTITFRHYTTHPDVIDNRYGENRGLRAGQFESWLRQLCALQHVCIEHCETSARAERSSSRRQLYEEDRTHPPCTTTALACTQFPRRLQDRNARLQGSEDSLSRLSQTIRSLLHTFPTSAFHLPITHA